MPPAPADVTRPRNSILRAAREELTLARQIVVEAPQLPGEALYTAAR